jgi:sigma-B regulation protein RsbU (phosphoserine phosphatase)
MGEAESIPQAILEVLNPDGTRRQVEITESPFLMGRGAEGGNHLQLADKRVSRRSAAVLYKDGQFSLEDRGQRHGILLNGEQVEARVLQDGDIITLGTADSLQLVFRTGPVSESLPRLLTRLEEASALEPGTRDLRPLGLLLEATALLQSHLPLEELLGAMVDRALAVTDADRGLLLEKDAKDEWQPLVARLRGGRRAPLNSIVPTQTAVKQAVEKRRSVVEQDVDRAAGSLRMATSVVEQQLRSVIALPLQSVTPVRATDQTMLSAPGTLLGVLYLDSRRPAAFSRLEQQILEALAREAASVLDNARLLQREKERRRMEQELDIARQIQQALLPRDLAHIAHLEVTGMNRSCLAVGGDYFDVMEVDAKRTGFLIADVCGKGLGAALLTAMLQGSFSAMALGQEPGRVCEHINRFICTHSEMERYATLFCALVDDQGQLEFVNAGHPSPLLVRGGKVEMPFKAGSVPVGLVPNLVAKTTSAPLEPGDTLVLFTDGISEAENLAGEMFGLDRLRDVVAKHASLPVRELQGFILKAVDDFSRGAYQSDDITLLIVRYPQKD